MSIAGEIDHSHAPELVSWVESAANHADFPVQNLPIGIFSRDGEVPRMGVAIGEKILDITACLEAGLFEGDEAVAARVSGFALNAFLALPPDQRRLFRHRVCALLTNVDLRPAVEPCLHERARCAMHLPAIVGDFTDFYAGIHHARKATRIFRPDAPLAPNYMHVPVGYHGRSSSVVASGHDVYRPYGQVPGADGVPVFVASRRLDFELEMGIWIGAPNPHGTAIPIANASRHIAGLSLLNDWSARDMQGWEMTPLGPFLSKNFVTTTSPWIVTMEALAPFRLAQPARAVEDPKPLDYLWDEADQSHGSFAIELEVLMSTTQMRAQGLVPVSIGKGAFTDLYWTIAQLVTHHSVNGCPLRPGDLIGTGTISTEDESGPGCLLEKTLAGREPFVLPGGETRTFLEDGDEIIFRAHTHAAGRVSIGFGECVGRITSHTVT